MKKRCVLLLTLSTLACFSYTIFFQELAFADPNSNSASPSSDSTGDTDVAPTPPVKPKRFRKKGKKAASTTPDSIEPIPDGDSCGLGWKVTDKRTLSAVLTRSTTNVTVPPTFGMTSGTIGCKQIPLSKREVRGLEYAFDNHDEIKLEMAEGDGEFLRGFSESLGCQDAIFPEFARDMQSHFREITRDGSASGIQLFNAVRSELRGNPILAASCGAA